jgi:hypothetical protein
VRFDFEAYQKDWMVYLGRRGVVDILRVFEHETGASGGSGTSNQLLNGAVESGRERQVRSASGDEDL